MNFKDLTEPECGGANPLMRLGQQLTNDYALRDEGVSNLRDPNFQPAESVKNSAATTFETCSNDNKKTTCVFRHSAWICC